MNKELSKILVVEDESIIAFTLKEMLHELGYAKVKIADNYTDALTQIKSNNYALAILDINLKNGDEGLKLAKHCHELRLPFFYLTSYTDKETLDKAIETAPGAYIIKPFMLGNIYSAVELTLNNQSQKNEHYISFKEGGSQVKIALNEILFVKAENIYLEFHTKQKVFLYRSSLKKLMENNPADCFIQCHRSFAVNPKYIEKIKSSKIYIGENELPLSRSYKDNFDSFFENML